MSKTTELAWAAGLFEGEGCFTKDGGSSLRATLSMTDEDIIRRFARIMGFGKVKGPYKPSGTAKKARWVWDAGAANFNLTVSLLSPWLGERRLSKATELIQWKAGMPGRWPKHAAEDS